MFAPLMFAPFQLAPWVQPSAKLQNCIFGPKMLLCLSVYQSTCQSLTKECVALIRINAKIRVSRATKLSPPLPLRKIDERVVCLTLLDAGKWMRLQSLL